MKIMIRAHDLGVKGEENIYQRINELSLDGIQLVAYKSLDGIAYERGAMTRERANRVKDVLSGKIILLGAYFNPVHPNREKAKLGEDIFCEYLALANELGCDTVGSETGSYMGDPWGFHVDNLTDSALSETASVFTRLADCAALHGVNIAIEGAYNHVCTTPERLFECIKLINRKNVRVIVDLYNYLNSDNYKDALSILDRAIALFGDSILLYHIKDFTVTDGVIKQCGVGKGILDLSTVLKRIKKQNPEATLVLEGTVGEDIPYAIAHLKKIISAI